MFDKEKKVINCFEIGKENEDVEVVIDEKVTLTVDTVFEDCNILIDLSKCGCINISDKKLKFVDSNIIFKGNSDKAGIECNMGNIIIEDSCNDKYYKLLWCSKIRNAGFT